jgi:hypothetical protein
MAEIKNNIYEIEPEGLSGFVGVTSEDLKLISTAQISKTFKPNDNFIELSYFSLDDTRLTTIPTYDRYSILSGDSLTNSQGNSEISIDVEQDYIGYGFLGTDVKALYNFLDYPYSTTNIPQDFYIESISPDRTEVRLISINLAGEVVNQVTDTLIEQYNSSTYIPDFYLYLGDNIYYSIVNIDKEQFRDTTAVLVKLFNPLPTSVGTKLRLNIVEKVGNSIAYEINSIVTPDQPVIPTLRGANFNVEVEVQATEPSQYYNYNELFSFPTNNTYRELNSLFNEKGAELGIDYSDFSKFINFSSAEERLRNFRYKLDLIESYQGSLDSINSTTYSGTGITGSREYYENLIKGVINNLDHYEKHLYFESGSTSWPKSNSNKPFINQLSSTSEAIAWYSTEIQDAILYDAQNPDILINTVPAYLKEDPDNRPYELFIHMIAQHFDNLWLYTNSVSKKYDADNRLNRGVSKDLVEELLRNFGVKLYTSNKSADDLFRYFTANSYNFSDEEIPGGITTSGQKAVSQNDYQKEIYKRIYHNLPLLMKSKGTERGLRALINCFGIPSDILKIKVYGGQSVKDLPFFGGEQAWTGSLNKVRTSNTGSIVPGDTLSFYTSIDKPNNDYTQDLHRIEVGFSPSDNIDSYIVSQSAVLFPNDPINIDQYIGDPREISTTSYNNLNTYRDIILEGLSGYNVKDFIRLIKFFDNVIFRMVRDFVPARSVTDAGIIIKPHLLERNKLISPVMSWTRPEYSGSINTAFISGSNAGAYKNVGAGSVGTLFNKESSTITNSYVTTPFGTRGRTDKKHDEPKFNGELNNSFITVTNGELNASNPFKNLQYPVVEYRVQFYKEVPESLCILEGAFSFDPLSTVIMNPSEPNNNYDSYNLGNLFFGSSGAYNYTVLRDGISTSYGNQVNQTYNFLQNYTQYEIIQVTAEHISNDIDFNGGCTSTRTVQIVECEIYTNPNNIPPVVNPNQLYDLTTWWNSTTSPNSDITYIINNVPYQPEQVESFTFSESTYTGGQTITIVIQENNDQSCSKEITVQFSTCTLGEATSAMQWTENIYDPPYGFTGTTINTQYYFRLEWCGSRNSGTCLVDGAEYIGEWVEITNGLTSDNSYLNITNTYPSAINFNVNESIPNLNYQDFDEIYNLLTTNFANTSLNRIQMRLKASNGICEVIKNKLIRVDIPAPEPIYYSQTVYRSSNVDSACCFYNPTTVYSQDNGTTYIGNTQFNYPIYSSIDPLTFATTGWYSNGSFARYWNGTNGTWGAANLNCEDETLDPTGFSICIGP